MTRLLTLRTALLAAAMIAAPAAATNLIVNGGFENTGFGGTGSYYNLGGGDATNPVPGDFGWTVPINNVDIIANGAYTPFLAKGGAYQLDLVGNGSTGAISQSFLTKLGRTYAVKIDYSGNGAGKTADVVINGETVLGTLAGNPSKWQRFSTSFAGTGGNTTFAINEIIGGGFGGVALDNISVSEVPEPASWAMMLAGFGMMGFAMRRRQKTVAA